MSDQFVTNDGYKPLKLPSTGEELQRGRQYYLSPVARTVIEEVYGLKGVPHIVECELAARPATLVERNTYSIRLVDGKVMRDKLLHSRVEENTEQLATFRAFIKFKNAYKFTIDLAKVRELEPFYADAPKVSDYEKGDPYAAKARSAAKESKLPDLAILDL